MINYKHFITIWYEVILGVLTEIALPETKEQIKKTLNSTIQGRLEELIEELEIDIQTTLSDKQFIQKIVEVFSNYKVHDNGFYPAGIVKYKGLTCAGSAMLASHLLTRKGIQHYYARPVGHSVNIAMLNSKIYWLDAHNGIYEEIKGKVNEHNSFKTLEITSNNPKIDYRLAIMLDPSDTYYQIFGNIEHLKEIPNSNLTKDEIEKLIAVDLNEVAKDLFPDIREYMSKDRQYKLEVKRKR